MSRASRRSRRQRRSVPSFASWQRKSTILYNREIDMRLRPLALSLIMAVPLLCSFPPSPAFAIGAFDASDLVVTPSLIQFKIANLDRTNDGDHGGYDGAVIYAAIYCPDTATNIATAPNATGPWNAGDLVSFAPAGYDGSPHTGCVAAIYTNGG